MTKKETGQFTPEEARKRFEAALRGARIAGHKPKDSMTPKRKKAQRKGSKRNEKS
jgi:hypothetical protein